jgi:hypothetical protein
MQHVIIVPDKRTETVGLVVFLLHPNEFEQKGAATTTNEHVRMIKGPSGFLYSESSWLWK